MSQPAPDVVVIGGGIVGLATGLALVSRGAAVTVVEKEPQVGLHQTGHNSGVIHTGIYYRPGSLKARLCVEGRERLIGFCADQGIPTSISGKVVVATRPEEMGALAELARRAEANGVKGVIQIDAGQLRLIEPEAAGIAALHVPGAGTVDFGLVATGMARRLGQAGAEVRTGSGVVAAQRTGGRWRLRLADSAIIETDSVVACAGLQSDRVAGLLGLRPEVRIVPFRGEYWFLRRPELVRSLIYPVPDPRFPFLGVHFTRRVDGRVEVGPNAVIAFAREGYSWGRIVPAELGATLATPGLGKLALRYWRTGFGEMARSLIPPLLTRAARALVPAVRAGDLVRGGAGVRAQALAADGTLVDDFALAEGEGVVAVLNAPSPAATASLAIGDEIAARVG